MANKKIRNDLILVGALVCVLLLVGGGLLLFRSEGDVVVVSVISTVTVDGEEKEVKVIYGTYPLNKDIVVDIVTGNNSENFNRLVIKDGKAYVEDANCPGGTSERCTLHAPISYDWESIICIPHKVTIAVKSSK